MSDEPVLRADDVAAWDVWMRTVNVHARTRLFARRVDSARRVVERALEVAPNASVSWSAGKDSTVLAHLVTVDRGARGVDLMSEKDDLDYPGEEDYVCKLAAAWGAQIRVVHPEISPAAWVAEHAATMLPGDEIHARSAALSKACFYDVVERANAGFDCVMLGLRAEESKGRRVDRAVHGRLFAMMSRGGQIRVNPISDWRGIDVYAYAESSGIELLPVYRCIGLMHAREPWLVRKSWWLPGTSSARGQVVWLRRYWPSLYARFRAWFPSGTLLG